jgi:hypothetical protein
LLPFPHSLNKPFEANKTQEEEKGSEEEELEHASSVARNKAFD